MIRKRSKTVAEMLRTLVQARAWRCLMHERPQHWALSRMFVKKYGEAPASISYCAGQDYTYEMGQLRKYLAR